MGLTHQSTGVGIMKEMFQVKVESAEDIIVALAGNPNTGKSTVFNSLTGLKQHTGNWPGKTVANAQGKFTHKNKNFILVDLPGSYSLMSSSVEEEIARDFICFGRPNVTVVVTDATCLERNLNLVLQILEITSNVVVCVNLIDEAKRKGIQIELNKLSGILGVPVVGTNARDGEGLKELKNAVYAVAIGKVKTEPVKLCYDDIIEQAVKILEPAVGRVVDNKINSRWVALKLIDGEKTIIDSLKKHLGFNILEDDELKEKLTDAKNLLTQNGLGPDGFRDRIVSKVINFAEETCKNIINFNNKQHNALDRKIDRILTSRALGIPIMILLLGVVFWITIQGANYPSELLATGLFWIEERMTDLFVSIGLPDWLLGILVLGAYRTLAWVISVMLPPMAIFFPLFTLLEDLGYLPRVAFNLDNFFKKACAHGKQALTMCMGFGCNAAGVIACRIIDSPRERLIATITNNFVPCNGRFPTLIALATIFIAGNTGPFKSIVATLSVLGAILLGVIITLVVSRVLSQTILKGLPSSFTLELPPYRKPQIGRILIRSLLDRTLFVLTRAVMVAAPAGLIIWLMANLNIGGISILNHCARLLNPIGCLLGLDGYILIAFILGFPANEIVIPIIIMSYMATGAIMELDSLQALRDLLVANGWTWLTAVCTMLFSLNHFPCGTTMLTIRKETQSNKWTWISFIVPTVTGIIVCFTVAQTVRLLGLV
ncbi:MAG: ferrous iron transport protein [Thermosediminibacterales bacterium]|nr:ferrous iron transport protein [Thermosediminibacterales bacterium]MDK2836640.1 ferrous iron transport protein [Thermosediminibacterales bacterium]